MKKNTLFLIFTCMFCALVSLRCAKTSSQQSSLPASGKKFLATGSLYVKGSTIPLDLQYRSSTDFSVTLYSPFGQTMGSLTTLDMHSFISHLDRTDTVASNAPLPSLEALAFSPSLSAQNIGRILARDWNPLTKDFDSLVVQGPERLQWKWIDEHRFKFTIIKGLVTEVNVDSNGTRLWRASYGKGIEDFPRRIRIAGPDNDYFTISFTHVKLRN